MATHSSTLAWRKPSNRTHSPRWLCSVQDQDVDSTVSSSTQRYTGLTRQGEFGMPPRCWPLPAGHGHQGDHCSHCVDTAGIQLINLLISFSITFPFSLNFVFLHKFKRIFYCSCHFKGYFPLIVIMKHWLYSFHNTFLSLSYTQ